MFYFSRFLGPSADFHSIQKKEQVLSFLDTRIMDPDMTLTKDGMIIFKE
jgi:hypothetical protein